MFRQFICFFAFFNRFASTSASTSTSTSTFASASTSTSFNRFVFSRVVTLAFGFNQLRQHIIYNNIIINFLLVGFDKKVKVPTYYFNLFYF